MPVLVPVLVVLVLVLVLVFVVSLCSSQSADEPCLVDFSPRCTDSKGTRDLVLAFRPRVLRGRSYWNELTLLNA